MMMDCFFATWIILCNNINDNNKKEFSKTKIVHNDIRDEKKEGHI